MQGKKGENRQPCETKGEKAVGGLADLFAPNVKPTSTNLAEDERQYLRSLKEEAGLTSRRLNRMEERVRREVVRALVLVEKHTRGGNRAVAKSYHVRFDPYLSKSGDGLLGLWAAPSRTLYLNPMLFRLPQWRFREVVLHETVHMIHPERSEAQVCGTVRRVLDRYGFERVHRDW